MPANSPSHGSVAAKGDNVAGVVLEEPISEGQRFSSWRGRRSDGTPATIHFLSRGATKKERKTFLDGVRRLQAASRTRPLPGVVDIFALAPMQLAYVARGGAVGTMEDLSVLGWGKPEIIAFLRRLCEALGELHQRGFVHGCLAPANVLIDSELRPRLCNVGLLSIGDFFGGPNDMSHDYARYAAREVRAGEAPSVASDLFSVGRLLYFALSGEPPDEADEDTPVLVAVERQPPGLVRIIRRCTLREPGRRYPDVAALLEDLDAWESGDVGGTHPRGREGASDTPEPSAVAPRTSTAPPAPTSDEGRISPRPPPISVRPPAVSARPPTAPRTSMRPSAPTSGPPGRSTRRPSAAPDGGDILSTNQRRLSGLLGGLFILGRRVVACVVAPPNGLSTGGLAVGVIGLALATPGMGDMPVVSRVVTAAVFGLPLWIAKPADIAAEAGRKAQLTNGTPLERAGRIRVLAAKGFKHFDDVDLGGLDLSQLQLTGASFQRSRLSGANFTGSRLAGASLMHAKLDGTDFSGADLAGATLQQASGWLLARCDEETVMPAGWLCDGGHPAADKVTPPAL